MKIINQNRDQAILNAAFEALRKTTGITGQVIIPEPITEQGLRADAQIEIEANGQRYNYMAQIKRVDRFAILAEQKYRFGHFTDQLLLVAPRITAETADKCCELNLQFIDTNGNAYLRQPGLFVLVKGQRAIKGEGLQLDDREAKRAGNATNLRMVFALLCYPELLNAPYRDITYIAGIALGAVGWVFFDLNARGFTIGGTGKGDRILVERQKIIQEWVTNYPIKLRPKLNPRKFRAPNPDWWKTIDVTQYGAQWGAEVAAEKLTGYLRPQTCTLYFQIAEIQKNMTRMVVENKLRADPQGDIEFIEAFWHFIDEPLTETVPPILVYADLLATHDPRNFEAAKIIYDRYIANTNNEA